MQVCVNVCVHGHVFERKRQMDTSGKREKEEKFQLQKKKNSKTWIKNMARSDCFQWLIIHHKLSKEALEFPLRNRLTLKTILCHR